MIKHINKDEFKVEVVDKKGIILVDFFATWCPPCKMLAPVLDEIASSRAEFDIVKVNIDENIELATEYKIEVVPTMVVFKDGKVVDRLVGLMSKEEIIDIVNTHI